MYVRAAIVLVLGCLIASGVIIDRIAILVGNSIVKDSDIDRDLRVTSFLNNQPLDLGAKARKTAANRLIDQIFIRKEIEIGDYPVATRREADAQLDQLISNRFKTEAALQEALRRYGITPPDLRSHFLWQLTVLRFIDTRFKPAVLVSDADIEAYYKLHAAAFREKHPAQSSLEEVRSEVSDILVGQRVDKVFFAWLDEQRKQAKIKYFEGALQ